MESFGEIACHLKNFIVTVRLEMSRGPCEGFSRGDYFLCVSPRRSKLHSFRAVTRCCRVERFWGELVSRNTRSDSTREREQWLVAFFLLRSGWWCGSGTSVWRRDVWASGGNWFLLCWTDELFHKVAEDYNNTAFQYMTGECFLCAVWMNPCTVILIDVMTTDWHLIRKQKYSGKLMGRRAIDTKPKKIDKFRSYSLNGYITFEYYFCWQFKYRVMHFFWILAAPVLHLSLIS